MTDSPRETVKGRFLEVISVLPEKCLPFASILVEALEMHNRKSQDYGKHDDPYYNVRASEEVGIPAWKGGFLRSLDKVTRLKKFCVTDALANESAEDSMIDLCVYFPIILMLYREASKGVKSN